MQRVGKGSGWNWGLLGHVSGILVGCMPCPKVALIFEKEGYQSKTSTQQMIINDNLTVYLTPLK